MREESGHPAGFLSRAFALRGCSDNGFGFKLWLAGLAFVWCNQQTEAIFHAFFHLFFQL